MNSPDHTEALFLHVPVIHQGLLDLLAKQDSKVRIFIFDEDLLQNLGQSMDIASVNSQKVQDLLVKMGWNSEILTKQQIQDVQEKENIFSKIDKILLIDDTVGHNFADQFIKEINIDKEFLSIFLRWDRNKVFSQQDFFCKHSHHEIDQKFMSKAYELSQRSGDWWRQVGALIVKDGKIILEGWNKAMPDEHLAYKYGAIRDLMEVGEKPELTHYIHAEQSVISKAARKGMPLAGTQLYVTHFPCPVCAKLIAESGIETCFFSEGSANLLGDELLAKSGVRLIQVMLK